MIRTALCDTQEALYDTPSDGKVLTPKGSLYQHKEYDDVADRPYEAPPKKESKIYDYLQRKDLFKLKRDELKYVRTKRKTYTYLVPLCVLITHAHTQSV